jgi:short subunit dehydrogenase-like uncharacterized protein
MEHVDVGAVQNVVPKKYRIVVFGATGFTGQYVVEEVARTVDNEKDLTWAIAGRNMVKLQSVLEKASKITGKGLNELPIIIADVDIQSSLLEMCSQAEVLLNCVGPYCLYGTNVVKACIESGTHYVDICGEPGWLEKMQLMYSEKAKERGVYILQACGFDCIPAEIGLAYTRKHFTGDLNSIECFLSLHPGPEGMCCNYGTLHSVIQGIAKDKNLNIVRRELFKTPLPPSQHRLAPRPWVFFDSDTNSWCIPFLGADRSVVYRSEYFKWLLKKQRPVQFRPYVCLGGLFNVFLLMTFGLMLTVLAKFSFGIRLLEKFPRLFSFGYFSHSGPSRKQVEGTTFSMTFSGHGYPSRVDDLEKPHNDLPTQRIVTCVSGPECGYAATSIFIVQSAYILISEADHLPSGGGVFTPGLAFSETKLMERLQSRGIQFAVVSK